MMKSPNKPRKQHDLAFVKLTTIHYLLEAKSLKLLLVAITVSFEPIG
jgi:hypothetical protein